MGVAVGSGVGVAVGVAVAVAVAVGVAVYITGKNGVGVGDASFSCAGKSIVMLGVALDSEINGALASTLPPLKLQKAIIAPPINPNPNIQVSVLPIKMSVNIYLNCFRLTGCTNFLVTVRSLQ